MGATQPFLGSHVQVHLQSRMNWRVYLSKRNQNYDYRKIQIKLYSAADIPPDYNMKLNRIYKVEILKNLNIWKATKHFEGAVSQIPPMKKPNGTWALSNSDKVDIFAEPL